LTERAFQAEDQLCYHGVDIEYWWIPSYIGIPGNEAADAMAKRAASHQCDGSDRCTEHQCQAMKCVSLAHINHLTTKTQSWITKEQIYMKLSKSQSYRPKKKWGIQKALQKIPKHKATVFLQLASGHTLIGTHLIQIKKKESDIY
jgi:hypothetical protein